MTALRPEDRVASMERVISLIRLGVVTFNGATYLLFASHVHRFGLALVVIVLALAYAVGTVLWRDPAIEGLFGPLSLTVLDNAFIAIWIYATGGFSSPYFVLFFAESAASVTRFDLVPGIVSMAASALVYLGVVLVSGGGPVYEVTVRVGYIFVIGVLAARMIDLVRRSERVVASAEAAAMSFQELAKLKSNFVANVSHELRTPLTAIRGAASTLTRHDGKLEPAARQELAEMIDRKSLGLSQLIEDLIDIGLVDEGHLLSGMMTVDLAPLLHQEVADYMTSGLRIIDVDAPDFGIKVRCDPTKVMKAFRKLLENADKFSEPPSPIRVALEEDDKSVRLSVRDRGVGIDRAHLDQIFDRFYQVDASHTRSAAGTGVGLTIAHEIVRLHGGVIEVDSSEGRGSTFSLVIPKTASLPRVTRSS
ncbi:MAG: two-component system, OmpR family, phosphate regulon sensor histidine kinase PhoR [Actinomycetota bacterium]|nr:two-component system, OmpR family, phosphate regulon sensor histidine kinase PhoR [Actinomycetota bacterium]